MRNSPCTPSSGAASRHRLGLIPRRLPQENRTDYVTLTDNIASVSRRLAQTKFRKLSAALFRLYPVKRGVATIRDFDEDLAIDLDRGSYISSAIYWGGYHSLSTVQFLRSFLQP